MFINDFTTMLEAARNKGPKRVAVAAAHDPEVLRSLAEAREAGIIEAGYLVGDARLTEALAKREGLSLDGFELIDEIKTSKAARRVVLLAREGKADIVVKGQLKTAELLSTALNREIGLRERRLMTHVGIFEIPGIERLIYISDSGVVPYPDVYQKLEIIRNAVEVAHRFGLKEPKVAILAATEAVHPKIPASIDALALAKMAEQGWVEGAIVDGPMALDTAISEHSARVKGIKSPVAGRADILIVPNVEAGNIMAKGIQYFAHARMAGHVMGAKVPILINSRADTAETRFLSLAMAVYLA
ncbi:MAG TPA: bifunctional enoyl-CoA hydratase/phosphate acetyltransferase [Chloroflexi bacterium]|nr:bifunctional enoyl-CoA hydratase/phosphate acetyltransferase [Chloroflexota bacterium]